MSRSFASELSAFRVPERHSRPPFGGGNAGGDGSHEPAARRGGSPWPVKRLFEAVDMNGRFRKIVDSTPPVLLLSGDE